MMSSPRIEEYLEAIFKIQEKTQHSVNISRLAEHLNLSVPSASEMMKKLAQIEVITYNKQREVSLTKSGLQQAAKVVRRHRLAERFLTDTLGLTWDQVHDEACLLEHAISEKVEGRLAKHLNNPETCPHGYPIPTTNGKTTSKNLRPLSALKVGEKALVSLIGDETSGFLIYLANLKIRPGIELSVEEIAPFGGPITISIDGKSQAVGPELAAKIMVEK